MPATRSFSHLIHSHPVPSRPLPSHPIPSRLNSARLGSSSCEKNGSSSSPAQIALNATLPARRGAARRAALLLVGRCSEPSFGNQLVVVVVVASSELLEPLSALAAACSLQPGDHDDVLQLAKLQPDFVPFNFNLRRLRKADCKFAASFSALQWPIRMVWRLKVVSRPTCRIDLVGERRSESSFNCLPTLLSHYYRWRC